MEKRTHQVIQEAFAKLGYNRVKPEQMTAIEVFLVVWIILPTGFGKSLIYSTLPIIFDTLICQDKKLIVVAVSPLLALMQDQVEVFSSKGISSVCNTTFDIKGECLKGSTSSFSSVQNPTYLFLNGELCC